MSAPPREGMMTSRPSALADSHGLVQKPLTLNPQTLPPNVNFHGRRMLVQRPRSGGAALHHTYTGYVCPPLKCRPYAPNILYLISYTLYPIHRQCLPAPQKSTLDAHIGCARVKP